MRSTFIEVLSIPLLPPNSLAEVSVIKSLAHTNNISIDKLIRRKLVSGSLDLCTTLPRSQSSMKWVRLPFLDKLSFQLSHFPKSLGLSSASHPINTSKFFFPVSRILFLKMRNPVFTAYSVADSCLAVYLGQTGRSLKSRISEHSNVVSKNNPERSTFAAHILLRHTLNCTVSKKMVTSINIGGEDSA